MAGIYASQFVSVYRNTSRNDYDFGLLLGEIQKSGLSNLFFYDFEELGRPEFSVNAGELQIFAARSGEAPPCLQIYRKRLADSERYLQ